MAIRSPLRTALLAGLVVALAAPAVDARSGGGKSSGSRGSQTQSAPPPTATAPGAAQPMQRTQTPATATPSPVGQAAAAPSRGLGFGGGLMAGMLGAGLLGLMFGGGLFGGLGGIASMLGLLLQVALIGGLIFLAVRFFRRRSEPAAAGPVGPLARTNLDGAGGPVPGGSGAGGYQPRPVARQPIEVMQEDYQAFERLLGDVQLAYGREDVATLHRLATPEMVRYFEEDLAENRSLGVRNQVSAPKLLQGDLSEAWQEGSSSYATVAMRFSIIDAKVDSSGRVVEGSLTEPVEVTEIWTFRREGVGNWMLSAIQQTA